MPGRNFSSNSYRYGYNKGSEKNDEVKGDGNMITTHFRELDTRLGRWWQVDPKINSSESPYVSMSNNPIMFNDALGDSIRKTKSFAENKELMAAYNTWAGTREGKKFLKDYGVGGKHENIAVVFDDGPLTYVDKDGKTHKQNAEGVTISEFISGKNTTDIYLKYNNLGQNSVPENVKDAITGKSNNGDYVRFTIKFPGAMNNPARAAYNILHETQHLRVEQSDITQYRMIQHAYYQHKFIDSRKSGYVQETLNFMAQIRDTWIKDFYEQRHNQYGQPTIEKYIWNLTGFMW